MKRKIRRIEKCIHEQDCAEFEYKNPKEYKEYLAVKEELAKQKKKIEITPEEIADVVKTPNEINDTANSSGHPPVNPNCAPHCLKEVPLRESILGNSFVSRKTWDQLEEPYFDDDGTWACNQYFGKNSLEFYKEKFNLTSRMDILRKIYSSGRVIFHHTASDSDLKKHSEKIMTDTLRYHRSPDKKFSDIGYHFVITPDGLVYEGRPLGVLGSHAGSLQKNQLKDGKQYSCRNKKNVESVPISLDFDYGAIGVAMAGNFHVKEIEDFFGEGRDRVNIPESRKVTTANQLESLYRLLTYLRKEYGVNRIGPHNYYRQTSCPGLILSSMIAQITGKSFGSATIKLPWPEEIKDNITKSQERHEWSLDQRRNKISLNPLNRDIGLKFPITCDHECHGYINRKSGYGVKRRKYYADFGELQ